MDPTKKVSFINRFLISCSGASFELLKDCPRFEITKYSSIGMTIVFTAILAVFSSFFALSIIFDHLILNITLAILWGAIIFNLDRYIISSMRSSENKWNDLVKAIPRFIIAIIIAFIISKPMEIQIFKSEIDSFLKVENTSLISDIDTKYLNLLDDKTSKKNIAENQYKELLLIREQYYQDYKCECDGTCGTNKRGRGIECFSKKEKYETFQSEIEAEKVKRDAILEKLAFEEASIRLQMQDEKSLIKASLSYGLMDQIRALSSLDSNSSLFIVMMFIMIEIAPILTKIMSSKGPYENLILEYEKKFEMNYLKALDNLDHERVKNKKLKEISTRFEIKSKEKQIQDIVKQDAYDRYEKIRTDLENKIAKN
ncbi:DUF4407 domain-containing protein [Flavobacteriaceae bacterium]|nr:DUF4407 domain-containing protein [Flavobacteriaceae bacterium]MDA7797550.1 DUF4407 domain-containing protein [Flavobacteriaceae bacterium]MDA8947828.1 DUF4407 domain-containing protein [Flavobacteriaceae bacterium]